MRKGFLVLLAASMLFFSRSNAQLLKSSGVKFAYTSASQDFKYTDPTLSLNTLRRSGIGAGVYAEWLNLPIISVVTEADYVQRGIALEVALTSPDNPDGPIGRKRFESRLDYLFNYHDEITGPHSLYSDFKKPMVGATVGAGVEVRNILPFSLLAEFRYNADAYKTDLLKVRNNAFDIWLGVGL